MTVQYLCENLERFAEKTKISKKLKIAKNIDKMQKKTNENKKRS